MEWQPIETAPDRGEDWSETFLAYRVGYSRFPFPCKTKNGKFYDLDLVDRDGDWGEVFLAPDAWMPLPAPPTGVK